jgi:redox-sensitive bicupin YhaK (pirin superfamily)
MIALRRADERGHADHGWLDTRHSFSFADYYDPQHMGWGPLRVINEDRVQPGMGFGSHGHRDMEIVSVVLDGALQHKDSMGNGTVIRPGEVQRMSAGQGVMHSEFNASADQPVHFLQIWIEPSARGVRPEYEQKAFAPEASRGRLRLLVSGDGREDSLAMRQDAALYEARLEEGEAVSHRPAPGRLAYVHVVEGEVALNGRRLAGSDGAKIAEEPELTLVARGRSRVLLFDLPPKH